MVYWTVRRLYNLLLLVFCFPISHVYGIHFLTKDLALAAILGGILKPRFVPLPIPIPFPLKFQKDIHKPYPVPVHTHSFQAHLVDQHPWGYDQIPQHSHLSGTHALAELHSASENIDSLVHQLSLSSPGAVHEGHSNDLYPDSSDLQEITDIINFHGSGGDWWK